MPRVSDTDAPDRLAAPTIPAWTFHNPVRINFGRGIREQLTEELAGQRCLIVTTMRGRRQFAADSILGTLAGESRQVWVDNVTANPGLHGLQAEIDGLANESFDAIIAFGGGSAMDAAKALSIALSETCSGIPLAELLASPGLHEAARPKRLYALPTTAGTGSEVTPFSTVWDHQKKKKHSLGGPAVFPYAAYVDPALTDGLPQRVTLSTGLDAINQASESIWNRNATPITMALATRAIQLGFSALPGLVAGRGGLLEREQMAECSLLAGLAISHTRTALCHSMSYPITAHFGVPHGLACAFTMPAVLRHNLAAEDGRLANLAVTLCGTGSDLEDLYEAYSVLHQELAVRQHVAEHIPSFQALLKLADDMFTPGRADNSLAAVDSVVVERILNEAWHG